MTKKQPNLPAPELREIVKEHDRRVYNFCEYMLHDRALVDTLCVGIFSEFGKVYRRLAGKVEGHQIVLRLYQIAWERIENHLLIQQHQIHSGRDTRKLKGLGEDLLKGKTPEMNDSLREQIFDRLLGLDPDFRAPVVLRDILGFSDEEVTEIIGVRWGVYRHRLNRGRLEFRDYLRGRLFSEIGSQSATV